ALRLSRVMNEALRAGLVAIAALLSIRSLAGADTLAGVRASGELVWGADQEGGGPYVYPSDDDPSEVTGFEVELAARLARSLGVKPRFFQAQWDKLPDLLRTRKIDIILNGYEWMPSRLETMDATVPYFVYGLQLLARKDDAALGGAGDLEKRAGSARRRKV